MPRRVLYLLVLSGPGGPALVKDAKLVSGPLLIAFSRGEGMPPGEGFVLYMLRCKVVLLCLLTL